MTILEKLAATTDPGWVDMINRRRPSIVDDGISARIHRSYFADRFGRFLIFVVVVT